MQRCWLRLREVQQQRQEQQHWRRHREQLRSWWWRLRGLQRIEVRVQQRMRWVGMQEQQGTQRIEMQEQRERLHFS